MHFTGVHKENWEQLVTNPSPINAFKTFSCQILRYRIRFYDKTPLWFVPPFGQNPLRLKPPFSKNPRPAKNPLQQKKPSGQNPSPTKIPLRPKTTADKNSPPGKRVRLPVVITKNWQVIVIVKTKCHCLSLLCLFLEEVGL